MKHAVVERAHGVDGVLGGLVADLLAGAMGDEDRHVRRAAVVSLSAVAHQKVRSHGSGGSGCSVLICCFCLYVSKLLIPWVRWCAVLLLLSRHNMVVFPAPHDIMHHIFLHGADPRKFT